MVLMGHQVGKLDGRKRGPASVRSVRRWATFYEKPGDHNSNKINKATRGIVLLSHLHGRSWDLCAGIEDDVQKTEDNESIELIINKVYKRDPLSVVTLVYH